MNALFYCYGLLLGILVGFFISEYINYRMEQRERRKELQKILDKANEIKYTIIARNERRQKNESRIFRR